MSNLSKLNSIWESLNEEKNVSRETNVKPTEEDTVVAAVAVSTKQTSSKKSLYGDKKEFVIYKDDNSKEPTPVDREMGSKQAIKEFKVTNTAMEVTEPVPREMGAQDAVKKFEVTNTSMDTVEPVPREMGAQEAPTDYLKEYKSNISKVLKSIKESIKI